MSDHVENFATVGSKTKVEINCIHKLYGAGKVILKPAAPGTGIIAGGSCRAVLELAGIKNIRAKCLRSNTPINVVKATFEGLSALRTAEEVAALRGISVEAVKG